MTVILSTLVVGGCGGGSRLHRGSLSLLTIYASAPREGPARQEALDAIDAERLAVSQIGNRIGPFTVVVAALDDASPVTGQWSPEQVAANARTIAEDRTAIASITDALPGTPAAAIRILNEAGVLQINAGETMRDPPEATVAAGHRQLVAAFGPSAVAEAAADVAIMRLQRIRRLLVIDDGTDYGRGIARSVVRRAAAYGITIVRTRRPIQIADRNLTAETNHAEAAAVFVGGLTNTTSVTTWNRIAAADPRVELIGPSGLDTDRFAATIDVDAQPRTFLSEPGPAQSDLPPAGQTFVADFTAAYGHAPRPLAFFGYVATQAVLDAIYQAGHNGGDRAVIARILFGLRNMSSALGTYSIHDGTATIVPSFLFSTVKNGRRHLDRTVVAP